MPDPFHAGLPVGRHWVAAGDVPPFPVGSDGREFADPLFTTQRLCRRCAECRGPTRPGGKGAVGEGPGAGVERLGAFGQRAGQVGAGDVLGFGDDPGNEPARGRPAARRCPHPPVDPAVQGRRDVFGAVQLAALNELGEGRGNVQATGFGVAERRHQRTVGGRFAGLVELVGAQAGAVE